MADDKTPDLNDPALSLDRASAMAVMRARRRESAASEMAPEDAAAYLKDAPPITARDPNAPAAEIDPDADPDEAIAEATRKRLEAGVKDGPQSAPGGDDPALDPATQVKAQRAEETVLSEDQLGKFRIPFKVNGKEELLTAAEIRQLAQKTGAADDYLTQAKTLLNEVKELRRAAPPPAAPTPDAAPEPTNDGADVAGAFVEAMFAGKTEDAAAALRQALQRADPTQIQREVEQRIVKDSALRQFAQNHGQIIADDFLKRIADSYLLEDIGDKRLEDLPAHEIAPALERAGAKTEAWMRTQNIPVVTTQQRATTRNDRRAGKESIDELETTGARASTTVAPPKSASDIINKMKADRGQLIGPPT